MHYQQISMHYFTVFHISMKRQRFLNIKNVTILFINIKELIVTSLIYTCIEQR